MFFNTIRLRLNDLKKAIEGNQKQDEKILHFFQKNKGLHTPCEVWKHFQEYPLTSVRRAINTLTNKGLLIKSPIMQKGMYGRPNHQWTLKRNLLTNSHV